MVLPLSHGAGQAGQHDLVVVLSDNFTAFGCQHHKALWDAQLEPPQ